MEIRGDSGSYRIGKKVANAGKYRLFLCTQHETERQCLLQIAAETAHNGSLDRAAYILNELKRRSDETEAEYAKIKSEERSPLNYDLGFPELVDGFICSEQGGRRVNILAFRNVEDVSRMVPLINIAKKDRLRIDLRTSAWIMGKILKLLSFTHSEGFSVEPMNGKNILIEPDQHYVLIFDWAGAQTHPGTASAKIRRQEISQAAQAVITALGGDPKTGFTPDDEDEPFAKYVNMRLEEDQQSGAPSKEAESYRKEAYKQYVDYILRLARGNESNATRAHAKFYELVDSFWPREYYPFTTKPLQVQEGE